MYISFIKSLKGKPTLQPLIILYVNCLTHPEPGIKDVKVFCNSVPLLIYLLNNFILNFHTTPYQFYL